MAQRAIRMGPSPGRGITWVKRSQPLKEQFAMEPLQAEVWVCVTMCNGSRLLL
jgi:hypothetical protein